jgi:hypothetical protein
MVSLEDGLSGGSMAGAAKATRRKFSSSQILLDFGGRVGVIEIM